MVKKLSVLSGDRRVGQQRLIFIRGDPYEWCQSCLWAPKCKEKTFFQTAISRELNWRFLRELNCKPIFEQVPPGVQEKRKTLWVISAPKLFPIFLNSRWSDLLKNELRIKFSQKSSILSLSSRDIAVWKKKYFPYIFALRGNFGTIRKGHSWK